MQQSVPTPFTRCDSFLTTPGQMAERALPDPNPKVRAAAARALGPMGAVLSLPKLNALLNDREPFVVLAAAHSLFLLGARDEVYDIDCQILNGDRKSADGFIASQINELRDPTAVATVSFETGIGFVPFGGEAYEGFKRATRDDHTPVRVAAVKELATDPDARIDATLTKACSDKKWPVRAAAVYAIAKGDNPAFLTATTPALDDTNQIVKVRGSGRCAPADWGGEQMNGLFLIFATFLAATIEGVETMAILVGVGTTRGWRSTALGAIAGFSLLTGFTLVLGEALLRIPIQGLRVAVGSLLLILGLQWLKKALLMIARPRQRKPLPDLEIDVEQKGIDWYAFVVAFKRSYWKVWRSSLSL